MNFCQIPHSLSVTTQLKHCLPFFSSLHFSISNELHCSLTESEGRVIAAWIAALCRWVTCSFSLVVVGFLRIENVYGTRETDVQILILLLVIHDLGHDI